jgi:hypothetical protein
VPASASAATWARQGSAKDGSSVAVEVTTITEQAGLRRAWTRFDSPRPARDGAVRSVYFTAFNCTERTAAMLSATKYNRDGAVVSTTTMRSYEIEYSPSPPGTFGDITLRFVCSYPIGVDWRQIDGLVIEPN